MGDSRLPCNQEIRAADHIARASTAGEARVRPGIAMSGGIARPALDEIGFWQRGVKECRDD